MKTTATFFALLMICVCYTSMGANPPSSTFISRFLHPKDWAFEENRGQLTDPSGNNLSEIKYFGEFGGMQVYCTNQKFSFVFTRSTQLRTVSNQEEKKAIQPITHPKYTISASRIDFEFEGANPDVTIVPGDKEGMTVNYVNTHSGENGILGVSFYKTLTYKNLYDHIDMVISANTTGLEYEFVVHPGGNPGNIKLIRSGSDNMEMLTNGGVRYSTALGTLEESRPQSFIGSQTIKSNFIRSGNKLSFNTEEYDRSKDLVIDPGIIWSTYFGGAGGDVSASMSLDLSGNIYIAGYTSSTTGIATKGVYQTSLTGGSDYDVFVAKFTSNGKLIWATYFGGDSTDIAQGCATDNSGNVYVTGYTLSQTGLATKGAYQAALSGNINYHDAFLAKFNTNGGLDWSTYFGGGNEDIGWSVAVDGNSNAYLCGYTASISGIATKGSMQTSYGGGAYDAFVAKFSSAGSLGWATYFGGAFQDKGSGIGVDSSKNIYITGWATSPNGIATSGAYKTDCDIYYGNAFLACLDSNGMQKWGTYFGGNGAGDIGNALATNGKDKVYFTGSTRNTSNVATTGAYQTIIGGSDDVFVADFNTSGSINWATYYGGHAADQANGISSDGSGNIFITGYTNSQNQIATAGAFQTSGVNNSSNAFLAEFNSKGLLQYGTYYVGSSGGEVGWGIANDNAGNTYMSGQSVSSGLATTGAYQTSLGGSSDAFIAKFTLCNFATSLGGPAFACVNSTTSFIASNHPNSDYTWIVSGGTIVSGNNTDSITVKWNGAGSGSVSEKEINSLTGCNDASSLKVTITPVPTPVITGDTIVCPLTSSSYHVIPVSGGSYSWNAKTGSISSTTGKDSVVVFWLSPGKGSVSISETSAGGACKGTDIINVTVAPKPVAGVKIIEIGKGDYKFQSIDSSLASSDYSWELGGIKYGGYHIQEVFKHDGSYSIVLNVLNAAGCYNTFDTTLNVTDAGIADNSPGNMNWSVFPNPFKDQLEIHYALSEPGPVEITVCDILGKNVATVLSKNQQPGDYISVFDASALNLTEGIYLITMRANGGIETQRIVKD